MKPLQARRMARVYSPVFVGSYEITPTYAWAQLREDAFKWPDFSADCSVTFSQQESNSNGHGNSTRHRNSANTAEYTRPNHPH